MSLFHGLSDVRKGNPTDTHFRTGSHDLWFLK